MRPDDAASSPLYPREAAPLVPHQGAMCLLDTIQYADEGEIVALVTPRRGDLLAEAAGVFVHAALEWMAQAAAAWSTLTATAGADATPRAGMLLGVRRFRAACDFLPFDETLAVRVRVETLADNGLGHFSGALYPASADGAVEALATASLSVLEFPSPPPDG